MKGRVIITELPTETSVQKAVTFNTNCLKTERKQKLKNTANYSSSSNYGKMHIITRITVQHTSSHYLIIINSEILF
jgi:hypothetical protein